MMDRPSSFQFSPSALAFLSLTFPRQHLLILDLPPPGLGQSASPHLLVPTLDPSSSSPKDFTFQLCQVCQGLVLN